MQRDDLAWLATSKGGHRLQGVPLQQQAIAEHRRATHVNRPDGFPRKVDAEELARVALHRDEEAAIAGGNDPIQLEARRAIIDRRAPQIEEPLELELVRGPLRDAVQV